MRPEPLNAEKPMHNGEWINGGFFVLEPEVLEYIAGDETTFEREPLERLAADGLQRAVPPYRHPPILFQTC